MNADHHVFSTETRDLLEAAGWYPGRRQPELVAEWVKKLDSPGGFEIFPAAAEVLSEFGGLTVDIRGAGEECARTAFEIDPLLATGEEDRFEDLQRGLGRRLYPLGEVGHGHAFLAIGEDGCVYIVDDAVLASRSSLPVAVEGFVRGLWFSPETRRLLEAAGWYPGRRRPDLVAEWVKKLDSPGGFEIFPAAAEVLSEFGGLSIEVGGAALAINPLLAMGEEETFRKLRRELDRPLYPLGEVAHGHGFLAIREDGAVYIVGDEVLAWRSSLPEAVESFLRRS